MDYGRPSFIVVVVVVIVVVVAVVVVDLYNASRSASNALLVPLRSEKMSFQSRSEAVGTPSRVPERVWQRVPSESEVLCCVVRAAVVLRGRL